jgi:hypothetical protein
LERSRKITGKADDHLTKLDKIYYRKASQRADYILGLLNNAWNCLIEYPHESDFNMTMEGIPSARHSLKVLESVNKKLGITTTTQGGEITILSLLATITDIFCDRRLAAMVNNSGYIVGWMWYKEKTDGRSA